MATRRTGIDYEHEVKRWYEENDPDALHVMRSSGSHGEADVVVFYPSGLSVLIQCKAGVPRSEDRKEAIEFSRLMGSKYVVELWRRDRYVHTIETFINGEFSGDRVHRRAVKHEY